MKQPTHETPEVAAAIARARRPIEPLRISPMSLAERLRTTQAQARRRLLPTRLAVAHAERQGRVIWERSSEEREHARATITAIVAGTQRAGEVEQLAMQHVIEQQVREMFFWKPWKAPNIDPASKQTLIDALATKRAVLLSSCHLGPFFLGTGIVRELGHTPYSVAAPWLFQTPPPGPWGERLSRWSSGISARGERLIYSVGSFEVIRALLRQREIVKLYFDMPGGQRTQFLGKPVMLSGGSARLALQTEALVLPVRVRRVGHHLWTDIASPLDAREFTSFEELHNALAAAHERWILELPATLEDPNRDGAWERGATAHSWSRPQPTADRTHNRLLAS